MTSRKKRERNRSLAKELEYNSHICPECGERGKHWMQMPFSLEDLLDGRQPTGFWVCAKFYGPNGRRLEP